MNYFPLGIAKGDAFCNRVLERKQYEYFMIDPLIKSALNLFYP